MDSKTIKGIFRIGRISESLAAHGVEITHHSRSRRWSISGNTYQVRGLLKGAGFHWDAADRCWWSANPNGYNPELGAFILRTIA